MVLYSKLVLGPQLSGLLDGSPGFRVRINDDARKAVVFFGVPEPEKRYRLRRHGVHAL
jgi:hypothetical protein